MGLSFLLDDFHDLLLLIVIGDFPIGKYLSDFPDFLHSRNTLIVFIDPLR